MIAACPKCQTRYRVEADRLGPDGARLRCSQCSAVFRVRLPEATPQPTAQAPIAVAPAAAPKLAESRPLARAREGSAEAPRFDRERLVLVAHADPDACKRIAEALESQGLQVLVAHDGVEAILSIQRALPSAVALDAALPKMFGFQVCELVKRNESLRSIQVCLMGAIHKEDRYRRAPSELYGADVYLEPPALPGALLEWLARIGLPSRARRPEPLPDPAPTPIGEPTELVTTDARRPGVSPGDAKPPESSEAPAARTAPSDPPRPAAGRSTAAPATPPTRGSAEPLPGAVAAPAEPFAAERAQAERLARIIVSDIVLYNEGKFTAAIRSGNALEALREELHEGRALFRERIDARVREERDFLADELIRVARARGMA